MPRNHPSPHGAAGRPDTAHQLLGRRLRILRESRGITSAQAKTYIGASGSKISRIELGRIGIRDAELEKLLDLYGENDPEERLALLELNSRLNERKWWSDYGDPFSDRFCSYLVLESIAQQIWVFEIRLVPGFLQTPAYAETIIRSRSQHDDADVRRLVEVRKRRRAMVLGSAKPAPWVILDHSALTDGVDDAAVMREQIEFLIAATERVRIQILPPRSGLYALRNTSFSILRCRGRSLADVVYLENLDSAIYLDDHEESQTYRNAMEEIGRAADPPSATRRTLEEALRHYR